MTAIWSWCFSDKPTPQDLLEVQRHFGLTSPALVEKDWHVVKALGAITAAKTAPTRLVFGGGDRLKPRAPSDPSDVGRYRPHVIRGHYDRAEVVALARTIMLADAKAYRHQFPAYRENPIGTTRACNSSRN